MPLLTKEALFGDNGPNGNQVPIDLDRPRTETGAATVYANTVRAIGFGERLTSKIANRMFWALALNDEFLNSFIQSTKDLLVSQIAAVSANLQSAINDYTTKINTEANARSTADTNETNARAAADTLIRTDFANADNAVRGEFAAADTTIKNKYDLVYTYSLAATPPAINAKVKAIDDRVVLLESSTSVPALGSRVTALETLTPNNSSQNVIKILASESKIANLEGKVAGTSTLVNTVDTINSTSLPAKLDKSGGTITGSLTVNSALQANTLSCVTSCTAPTLVATTGLTAALVTCSGNATVGGTLGVTGQITTSTITAANFNLSPYRDVINVPVPVGTWSANSTGAATPRWRRSNVQSVPEYPVGSPALGGVGPAPYWCLNAGSTVQLGEVLYIPIRARVPTLSFLYNIRLGMFATGFAPDNLDGQFRVALFKSKNEIWQTVKCSATSFSGTYTNVDYLTLPAVGTGSSGAPMQFWDIVPQFQGPLVGLSMVTYDFELAIWNSGVITPTEATLVIASCLLSYKIGALLGD